MILILYLKTCPDIGSPTQSSLQFKVFQSGRPFPASGHGRLLLLPWSVLATQNCTAVNWSPKTFGRQQGAPGILELLGHFSESPTFSELLGHFFVSYFTKYLGKSAPKLLDLVNPPPFSTQNSKMLVHKKCPKTCAMLQNTATPLMEETQIKLHFQSIGPLGRCFL